ncbi:VOC family protein [Rhizobium sp. P44RR-XXIV]|uniref:VOC family protein n=1 Tax=Rhizobium sp. P44RR-XXIV TaxID=1921145 RepID=UPI000984E974|nr:VOC family protein [Rhizobium sp. P44RR-XXIV]TIX89241.1 VOC family protein [Rhizobium sp. P44RR-XXIV]
MTSLPHPLDHLVLPTVNIASARERLGRLGFTVAPDARHPFGTENACVFFADKTYLEPLGVTSLEQCEKSIEDGNVFVARDQAYRFRIGEDGFSGVVFGTDDAVADDERFKAGMISAGRMLDFSRPMRMPDGTETQAGFRLAFAADLRAPDFLAFCCQRINPLPADRSVLERHENAVTGIARVAISTTKPAAYRSFFEEIIGDPRISEHSFGLTIRAANADIDLLTPEGMEAFYDLRVGKDDPGLRARAILFKTRDLSVTSSHFAANGVTYTRKNNRILARLAPAAGALFAFEEIA